MRGNFGLKVRNSPKLPRIYMLDFIVMQMRKANREKRYCNHKNGLMLTGRHDVDMLREAALFYPFRSVLM